MNLPIGYQTFHKQNFFNYQFNRLYALGFTRKSDLEKAAATIKNREDYVQAFKRLAHEARADGRLKNSAFYLRGAEFFVSPTAAEKTEIYTEFIDTFYEAFADEKIGRHEVPYANSFLPAMVLQPETAVIKGTILIFGGFDSLIEEFFIIWKFFAAAGWQVIAFEGPGQGGALRLYGQYFDHDWEKPVKAILDYFNLNATALIGISMGGYWAIRAAAFEPRIQQVVSWSPVYDWLEQLPSFMRPIVHHIVRWEGMMNSTIRLRMRMFPILDHAMRQAMYMSGGDQPIDAVHWLLAMNKEHIHSQQVTQDVLLLGGENDTFQPVKLLTAQQNALVNAHSVTTRVFTKEESADKHCQMGNLNLPLAAIESWLISLRLQENESLHED